jgi:hypothetical protein
MLGLLYKDMVFSPLKVVLEAVAIASFEKYI